MDGIKRCRNDRPMMFIEACMNLRIVIVCVFFSSRRRHTRFDCDWSSDVCSSDLAELVREQALRLMKDELPHAITVEVQELGEKVIEADLLVETESQKQIVVGKGGSMVREIGRRARPEIEALVGHPVYLELRVKVKPRWRRDEATLERLGL